MGKTAIGIEQRRQVKVKINKAGHQKGLARAHRQAEKIVGIIVIMKKFVKELIPFGLFPFWVVDKELMEVAKAVILEELIKELGGEIGAEIAVILISFGKVVVIKKALPNHIGKALVIADKFKP